MLIKIRQNWDAREADVTPQGLYLDRRKFLTAGAGLAATALAGAILGGGAFAAALPGVVKTPYDPKETPTPFDAVTSYNNFYEFGTEKDEPVRNAKGFVTTPWNVTVDGLCGKPGAVALEDLIKGHALEERIYRMRCVEAWSMVIPWVGVPLKDVLARFEPASNAKYVAFQTLNDPKRMPGERVPVLDWPYREGLRLDEAMHPLTLLAVGLYGQSLPPQNGAPLRLVVPWKYGFKGIKSIVRISFVDKMPRTAWNLSAPREYGFYANVNPAVDHPRWSQAKERRIGEFLKRPTLPFNGYDEAVAGLYAGMDLRRNY